MQIAGVDKSSVFYPAVDAVCHNNDLPGQLRSLVNSGMHVMVITTTFGSIWSPFHRREFIASTVNLTKNPRLGGDGLQGRCATVVLLNGCVIKLPSKYLFIAVVYCCCQPQSDKLLFAVVPSQCRDSEFVQVLRINDYWVLKPGGTFISLPPQGSGDIVEEGVVRT